MTRADFEQRLGEILETLCAAADSCGRYLPEEYVNDTNNTK